MIDSAWEIIFFLAEWFIVLFLLFCLLIPIVVTVIGLKDYICFVYKKIFGNTKKENLKNG